MGFNHKEVKIEEAIEHFLCEYGGYTKDLVEYDKGLALDKKTLLSFVKQSQPKQWERYETIYGANSEKSFIDRFNRKVNKTGLLNVLRKGITDRGVKFKVIFFKPETSINKDTLHLYESNVISCVRQLHYSLRNNNSLDIVLFINGIPLVTMELKDQFSGQTVENAKKQYMFDRNPEELIFEFNKRTLVHFAVDLTDVYMTTRLQGANTVFLPFNQGSNGAGNVGGKGNPLRTDNFQTAYLWEEVLVKSKLFEIVQKYIHLEEEKDIIIFPRYHQLDVVTKLLDDVQRNCSGKNYLIQHSAGSGKSNSIAWLAHRLSGLHNANNEKIFNSIIIVTDRRVLDNQLQNTVYQFDHVLGVVEKIEGISQQLKDAINSGKQIIITTLQKFPVIYKEVNAGNRNFAIIVDEAHSSQTGEASKKLKNALANKEAILEEYARLQLEHEKNFKDDEDKMLDELASHGQHKNLSFFAFTATPKDKTLQMFGEKQPDGSRKAFHIYSMRQAIEERFIHDVLKNYMTYNMYFKIAKNTPDDPEVNTSQAVKSVRRFETLHPHNLSQKTAIIIEHFRENVKHKINGKAKAMVVTSSRLHAVRYLKEFRRYIEEKGYEDLDVLVAFSGTVKDEDDEVTEEKLNKAKDGTTIKESQLKEYFHTDEFNMLIVAEKYQTGFDEPLLHTMYVDKKLSGIKAVQTLSRINRICKGKYDTSVLDFENTSEEILKAFQPYYEATILTEDTNPNVVYDLKNDLDNFRIYTQMEIDKFSEIFYKSGEQELEDLGKITATLKPAIDRFVVLEDEDKDQFKSILARFNRIYSFITQVCRMFDEDLHKFSVFAKFLNKMLPKDAIDKIDLDGSLSLEYYKLEKSFEGDIQLDGVEDPTVTYITGETGRKKEKKSPLSEIIDKINDKFGTNFTQIDKVMMQLEEDFAKDESFVNFAKNNDINMFKHEYEKHFKDVAVNRYLENDEFFVKMMNDENFLNYVMTSMLKQVYTNLRSR